MEGGIVYVLWVRRGVIVAKGVKNAKGGSIIYIHLYKLQQDLPLTLFFFFFFFWLTKKSKRE